MLVVNGCGEAASIPSELEARAFLGNLVQLARAGDVEGLCQVADCLRDDRIVPLDAPVAPPVVLGTWVLPGATSGGQQTIGGRILDLCGIDAQGSAYRSQILVFRANGRLRTLSFRYWRNSSIAGAEPPVTAPGPPTLGCGERPDGSAK
jgi:hypothetical protein